MTERFICDLAWRHISVMPHGVSSICCVADHSLESSRASTDNKILNLSKNTVNEVINSDSYRKIRLEMLSGTVPSACRGCSRVERAGGISKRLKDGTKYNLNHDEITQPDGTITPDLQDIELRLGNYCNLKCRGCNAESSTSWIQDYHKLKTVVQLPSSYDNLLTDSSTDYSWCESDRFYQDLLNNSPNVKSIHISGGEPFLVPKHFDLLDRLIDSGKTNLGIHYITNLNYRFDKIVPALEKLKSFKYCSISFSIDDVNERNTYIRSLSDWNLTIENLKKFLKLYPEFYYSITQTINAYNFLYCEELYQYLKQNDCCPPHGINFNHIHAPDYLNATVLPLEVRRSKLDSIRDILPERQYSNLYGRYYNSPSNGKLEYFKTVTNEMDKIRNEKWSEIFPKLGEIL
jgi:organic radical activating enzyme